MNDMNTINNYNELAQILNDIVRFDVCQMNVLHDDMYVIMKDFDCGACYDVALVFTYNAMNDKLVAECNYGDDVLSFDCFSQHVSKCNEMYASDERLNEFVYDAIELWANGFNY